jgi:tetratricopeptide (TPR) repeat protein
MRKLIRCIPILTAVALLASAGAGCTARFKASYHLKRADRCFDAGQYQSAEIEYENVLRNAPQNARAWSRLGVIYFDEGRGPEALPVLLQAQRLDQANLDVRLKLGTLYLESGQPKQAGDEADFVMSRNPEDDQAPLLLARAAATNELNAVNLRIQKLQHAGNRASLETALGILALRRNDSKTAEACFNQAITLDPKFGEAYVGLAALLFTQKDLKQADHDFQMAASLAPVWSGNGVRYAQFKIMTGDAAEAEDLLRNIVAKTPFYLPAWMTLAQISASQNDYSNALILVGNVLNRDARNFEGLLFQGRIQLMQRKPAQAVENYEQMARIYPKAPSVLYALAQAYLANNETNQADVTLTQALNLKPDFASAILLRAQTELTHGNPARAIVSLNQLVRHQPHLAQAWLLLAEAYWAQGALDNALEIYQKLENSYPDNPQVPVLLGDLLCQRNQLTTARSEFQKALDIQSDYLPAIEQLVNLDLFQKQYAAALQRVQQLVVSDPNHAISQLLLGTALAAGGQTNQAESALKKAIKLQPDSQAAYLLLAQLYFQGGQTQKALEQLQIALNKEPNDLAAVLLKAEIYNTEGNYNDALDAYEKVLSVAPDNGVALNNLACIYADHLNQLDKAYPIARRASDIAPFNPYVADTLGWILYRRGEYTPALVDLRESVAKLGSVAEIQYHFGMACYMASYESDAIKALQRALELNGDFPGKDDCRQSLAILNIDPKDASAKTCAWLEKWMVNHPNDPVALGRLAAIYQSEGRTDKAFAADQAILNANPQSVFALANLAQLYASTDPQKACAYAKSAYDRSPGNPSIADLYGKLAFKTGDFSWSLTLLQLAAQAQPQNPDFLFDLGQAFYTQGKVSEAETFAKKALQADTNFGRAADARRFLAMTALAESDTKASTAQSEVNQILSVTPNYVPALMVKAAICRENADIGTERQIYQQILKVYPDFSPAQKALAIRDAENPKYDTEA